MPCWRPTSMVLEYHYYTGNEIEKMIDAMTKPALKLACLIAYGDGNDSNNFHSGRAAGRQG